jgi:3-ketosteroid 9alpha-monooxygenase subunit A
MDAHPRNFPTVIPSGWFQIGYSNEIGPGEVKPLAYFGRRLTMARTEEGTLLVVDADDWVASADVARVTPRPWYVKEVANLVMCWHHHQGDAPRWDIPDEIPEWGTREGIRNEAWTEWETADWVVRSCNEEMSENAVDSAHFCYLHGTRNLPRSNAEFDGPVLRVCSDTGMETPRGPVDGSVESLSYGFGMGIVRFKGLVETLNVGTTTPIDHDHCHLRFNFSVKKVGGAEITRGVGKAFVNEVKRQVEQDIPIWEHKIHLPRPMLCDGDGPIASYRRWAQQFYG